MKDESLLCDLNPSLQLEQAIDDYLNWMISSDYAPATIDHYQSVLIKFVLFIRKNNIAWDDIFKHTTLNAFKQGKGLPYSTAVRGLSRYLFSQNAIKQSLQQKLQALPELYEQYLTYYKKAFNPGVVQISNRRRVLSAFNDFLEKTGVQLSTLKIEDLDMFSKEFNAGFKPATCKLYRTFLRGFLRYLYYERGILKKDLAPLLRGAPEFAKNKPPKYLRPEEIEQLFTHFTPSSQRDFRVYAMLHLAYMLGLRSKEISLICLNDISFVKQEIAIRDRKNTLPTMLPLPEKAIKAIAAYIIGGRPKSTSRRLFLTMCKPYRPASPHTVTYEIGRYMRKLNLPSTAYWLRHTYAQNLLEAGTSIYEIKEMMGHDNIESSRKYLHINTKLMREVLFE